MAITTFDPMTESMKALLDKGEDVSVSDYQNCVPGTIAFDVGGLVTRGLWQTKRFHISDSPYGNFTVYGPKS